MTTRIDPDELVVPSLLKIYTDKKYPLDEDIVTRCLDHTADMPLEMRGGLKIAQPAHEYIMALCQTSILHVVSAKESTNVILSAGDYPMPELPPLPFPRVAIEAEEDTGWIVDSQLRGGSERYIIWAMFISERKQAEMWDVIMYWGSYNSDQGYDDQSGIVPYIPYTIHAHDGKMDIVSPFSHLGLDLSTKDFHNVGVKRTLTTFALELVQIISADKVPHVPVGFVSRQQRRQWKAKHPYIITTDKPRVYFVNLAHAGEQSHEEGDGSRVYHCRWLVRGHWRHYQGGKTKDGKRTFSKRSTWVKAHVKGPVGAPWKGRPIYNQGEHE